MNEQQIREALRAVADAGGEPSESAAWERITGRIGGGAAGSGPRRWIVGGAGLAIAAAAAVFVLVVAGGHDDEALEVGPAAESTSTTTTTTSTTAQPTPMPPPPETTTTTASEAGAPPAGLPEHPMAVVVQLGEIQRLDLYDADTGEVIVRGLAETSTSFDDVSVGPDGTVYYTEEGGDRDVVLAVPWDASAEPAPPFGLGVEDGAPTRAAALSPDGSTFAYVESHPYPQPDRIGLIDVASGARRFLEYPAEEAETYALGGFVDLAFSPDGRRLAFTYGYEGTFVGVVSVGARSPSEAETFVDVHQPTWVGDDALLAVHLCCYGEADEPNTLRMLQLGAGQVGEVLPGNEVRVVSVAVEAENGSATNSRMAVLHEDGTIEIFEGDVPVRTVEVDGEAMTIGF